MNAARSTDYSYVDPLKKCKTFICKNSVVYSLNNPKDYYERKVSLYKPDYYLLCSKALKSR